MLEASLCRLNLHCKQCRSDGLSRILVPLLNRHKLVLQRLGRDRPRPDPVQPRLGGGRVDDAVRVGNGELVEGKGDLLGIGAVLDAPEDEGFERGDDCDLNMGFSFFGRRKEERKCHEDSRKTNW